MRWVNQDAVPHGILPDNNFEPDIGVCTEQRNKCFPSPGESFEYVFTNLVRYGFRGEPGTWLRGLVEVFPELCKGPYVNISIEELKGSYKVGEPVAFKVTVKRYGSRCDRFIVTIENEDAPENFSYLTGAIPSCSGLSESFQDFKRSYQIGYEGQDMFCPCSHKSDRNVSLLSVLHKDENS
jgi:hypothetical protein